MSQNKSISEYSTPRGYISSVGESESHEEPTESNVVTHVHLRTLPTTSSSTVMMTPTPNAPLHFGTTNTKTIKTTKTRSWGNQTHSSPMIHNQGNDKSHLVTISAGHYERSFSPPTTPFHFSSFPSSLPRIQNRPSAPDNKDVVHIHNSGFVNETLSGRESGHFLTHGNVLSVHENCTEDARQREGHESIQQFMMPQIKQHQSTPLHPPYSLCESGARTTNFPNYANNCIPIRTATTNRKIRRTRQHRRSCSSSSSSSTCSSTNSNGNPRNWLSPLASKEEEDNVGLVIQRNNAFAVEQSVVKSRRKQREANSHEEDSFDAEANQDRWASTTPIHAKLFHDYIEEEVEEAVDRHDTSRTMIDNHDRTSHSNHGLHEQNMTQIHKQKVVSGAFTPFRYRAHRSMETTMEDDIADGMTTLVAHRVVDRLDSDDRGPILYNYDFQKCDSDNLSCSPYPTHVDAANSKLRFHLDESQYSPIPTVSDEFVRNSFTKSMETVSSVTTMEGEIDIDVTNSTAGYSHSLLILPRQDEAPSNSNTPAVAENVPINNTMNDSLVTVHSDTSSNNTTVATGSTGQTKRRVVRPMPDMSAFEMGWSETTTTSSAGNSTSTIRNNSSLTTDGITVDRSKSSNVFPGVKHGRMGGPPKWLCPPTPIRTPAWAQGDGPMFQRADSLITSKVLATCPQHILDGLSSLENSFMDEDNKSCNGDSFDPPLLPPQGKLDASLALSFSTVLEEDEIDSSPSSSDVEKISTRETLNMANRTIVGDDEVQAPLAKRRNSRDPTRNDIKNDRAISSLVSVFQSISSASKQAILGDGSNRHSYSSSGSSGSSISFRSDFEILSRLGSGSFADVFKARCKSDNNLYAIKRSRRQFRGKRDRDRAMAEVRIMQRLQRLPVSGCVDNKVKNNYCIYLLFFIRAWQEEGYFYCQTELCCRDSCRHLMQSLSSDWNNAKLNYPSLLLTLRIAPNDRVDLDEWSHRILPEQTVWKILHDVCAGLSHIHSHGIVHLDIKPENIFFISHVRLGALCKIGDFGVARDLTSAEEGEEGDTAYMAPELLLSSAPSHLTCCDIFSLGLTLYELSSSMNFELPTEGPRWHDLRSGEHAPVLPLSRTHELRELIQLMISNPETRPSADQILDHGNVFMAGNQPDKFLAAYITDVEKNELQNEKHASQNKDSRFTPTQFIRRMSSSSDADFSQNVTPTPR